MTPLRIRDSGKAGPEWSSMADSFEWRSHRRCGKSLTPVRRRTDLPVRGL